MTNRALFNFNADGGNQIYVGAHSATINVTLRVPSGVSSWMLQVWDPSYYDPQDLVSGNPPRASKSAPLLVLTGTTVGKLVAAATPAGTITVPLPATGTHSWIVRSIVDGGHTNGSLDPDKIWERGLCVVNTGSVRKPPVTETLQFENNSWAGLLCDLIDLVETK